MDYDWLVMIKEDHWDFLKFYNFFECVCVSMFVSIIINDIHFFIIIILLLYNFLGFLDFL